MGDPSPHRLLRKQIDDLTAALRDGSDVVEALTDLRAIAVRSEQEDLVDEIDLALARHMLPTKPTDAMGELTRLRQRSIERGAPGLELRTLRALGTAWVELGDLLRARAVFMVAVERAAALGDRHAEAIAHANVAYTWGEANEPARYVEHTRPALEILRDLGDVPRIAHALVNLASGLVRLARYDDAADAIAEARRYADDAQVRVQAFLLSVDGEVRLRRGDVSDGLDLIRRARRVLAEAGHTYDAVRQTLILASSLMLVERHHEAIDELRAEIRRVDDGPYAALRGQLYDRLAEAAEAAGDYRTAYRALRHTAELQHALTTATDVYQTRLVDENVQVRFDQLVANERRSNQPAQDRHHRGLAAALAREQAKRLELAQIAISDPLTGCHNRRGLDELGEQILDLARVRGWPVAALLIDIDRFKRINDAHGHRAGDLALVAVADRLRDGVREGDLVARIGGDEFVVLMSDTTAAQATIAAERLRRSIAAPELLDAPFEEVRVTITIGVAEWDRDAALETLVDRADKALYLARSNGRDRLAVLSSSDD